MKNKCIIISFIIILLLCLPFGDKVFAFGDYNISNYDISVVVDQSAVFDVTETISIENCEALSFKKAIMKTYSHDVDEDHANETYTYGISDIAVDGATYKSYEENGKIILDIQLINATQELHITYKARMRNFDEKDKTTILFSVLDPSMAGTIENFNLKMDFPYKIDDQLQAFDIDRNGVKGQTIQSQIDDKTFRISTSLPLDPGAGMMLHGIFRKYYFTYSNAFTLQLYISIISILFVMGSYIIILFYPKMRKKKTLIECYPIESVRIGTLGYIMDGYCDERDVLSLIIEWGNQNHIQIRDENQSISIRIVNELPQEAPEYEKHLFNMIFGEYTMVTIEQLQYRHLAGRMHEIEEEIYQAQAKHTTHSIYTNTSLSYQLLYNLLVSIPLGLALFACGYEESYSFIISLTQGFMTAAFVFINCYPWGMIMKRRYALSKSTHDVYCILTGLINLICGGIIYSYMLQHQTPTVYVVIAVILTILEACVMIFMEKRTYFGGMTRSRLISLRHFICRAQVKQLESLLLDNPYYFEDMLPYAYYFDITDTWGKKFTVIQLQAPFWYYHTSANANSSIYWMSSLDKSLKLLQKSLMTNSEYENEIDVKRKTKK